VSINIHQIERVFRTVYTRGLISLWLYKENKLWDWKNVFTVHIPPLAPRTYDFVVVTSLTHPRIILLIVLQIGKAKDLSPPLHKTFCIWGKYNRTCIFPTIWLDFSLHYPKLEILYLQSTINMFGDFENISSLPSPLISQFIDICIIVCSRIWGILIITVNSWLSDVRNGVCWFPEK
jgi:hypothetical protein